MSPAAESQAKRHAKGTAKPIGRDMRQEIPTGTVAEHRSVLARIGQLGATDPEAVAAVTRLARDRHYTLFPDQEVSDVITILAASGLPQWVQERIDRVKEKDGRPVVVSPLALMVALLLTSTDFRGTLLCEVRDILYERISPRLQAELGLTRAAGGTDRAGRRRRSQTEARRVERAFHRLRKVMDPSIHMKGKKLTWVELSALNRVLTVDEQVEQRAALETFSNTLLAATELALDPKTRTRHDGSAGIDATPIRLWARGQSIHSEDASTDPDGGNYVRTGDHTEENSGGKKETGARRQNRIKEAFYGMDVSLMVAGDSTGGDRLYYPPIAIAVTLDRPGVDQAGAARRMIASLAERGHKPGFLAGDGLYSNSAADAFHTPARQAGWKLVLPLGKDQSGKQATHPSGAVMVDGDWMCPAIPDENADAVKLLRERQITLAEFRTLIEQRVRYRLKVHDVTASGQVRRKCGAAGKSPMCKCENKPPSVEKRLIHRTPEGEPADHRPTIYPAASNVSTDNPPPICTASYVTIPDEAGAKWQQDLPYGTADHANVYNALRDSQEGFHGFVKDGAKEALEHPDRRRVHGIAAQGIFTAFLLAAANLRKIRTFYDNAEVDENGDYYVRRKTTGIDHEVNPPGAAPSTPGETSAETTRPDTETPNVEKQAS